MVTLAVVPTGPLHKCVCVTRKLPAQSCRDETSGMLDASLVRPSFTAHGLQEGF